MCGGIKTELSVRRDTRTEVQYLLGILPGASGKKGAAAPLPPDLRQESRALVDILEADDIVLAQVAA